MSDLAPEITTGDLAPVETPAVETPAAPVTPETDLYETGAETFPREYVERLRTEAAERRTALNPFKEAFDGYGEEEVQTLLSLVHTLSTDPETAAAQMEQIVQAIREQSGPPQEVVPEFLTKDQLDQHLAQREQARAVEDATAQIESTAKELGYAPGTPDYIQLLWRAQNQTGFDLTKAHEAIQADKQKAIDAYIEGKRKEADGSPTVGGPAGAAVSGEQVPKTFASAREALEARLGGIAGQ